MSRSHRRWLMAALPVLFALVCAAASDLQGTTVIVVRHAEKADGSYDAELSRLGKSRAEFLADLFEESGIQALFATRFRRTQDTLRPLAERLGLEVEILDADDPDALIQKITREHPGETVMVASHSNRVPEIVEKLNGGAVAAIEEDEYDHIFVVTMEGPSGAKLLRLTLPAARLEGKGAN